MVLLRKANPQHKRYVYQFLACDGTDLFIGPQGPLVRLLMHHRVNETAFTPLTPSFLRILREVLIRSCIMLYAKLHKKRRRTIGSVPLGGDQK